jgi:D-alanyl-lipoteichoic acid acyltransferase DltB (MBOAT superfamily)
MRQILWGLFKKVVIADQCAEYANMIFDKPSIYSGSDHVMGALFFTFQIYCDFSGYSDIALGTARLFGIDLLRNFAFPYFSRDIAEFWRRWHISLSTWFRDYLYIPLGGSKGSLYMRVRNIFAIFLVSGFWHGANWTFIIWGLLNALYIMPSIFFNTNRNNIDIVAKGKYFPTIKDAFSMAVTFCLVVFAWIFFRSESVFGAIHYISKIFSASLFAMPTAMSKTLLLMIFIFMGIEWLGREHRYAIENIGLKLPKPLRWMSYYLLVLLIFYYSGSKQQFIYFQF